MGSCCPRYNSSFISYRLLSSYLGYPSGFDFSLFVFLYSMFVDIEEYYYKTKYTMYATTISAVANIIMNYFGIKLWGYIACAYTTLICYILLAILHLFWSNKASNNHGIHINQIFNIKYICLLSFFLTIGGLLFILTYENQLVRYFFFLTGYNFVLIK